MAKPMSRRRGSSWRGSGATSAASMRSSSTRKGTSRRSFQRSTSSRAAAARGSSPLSLKVMRSQTSGTTSEASRTPPGMARTSAATRSPKLAGSRSGPPSRPARKVSRGRSISR